MALLSLPRGAGREREIRADASRAVLDASSRMVEKSIDQRRDAVRLGSTDCAYASLDAACARRHASRRGAVREGFG